MLPNLEPLTAGALALNLAYLNLERFRYRDKIRSRARTELDRLNGGGSDNTPRKLLENRWFQEVDRLAALPNHDPTGDDDLRSASYRGNGPLPAGPWGRIYNGFYERHQDMYVTCILTVYSIFLLALGTAHSSGILISTSCWFSADLIAFTFWGLVVSILAPIAFVIVGKQIVRWGKDVSKENVNGLVGLLSDEAKDASLKT